MHPVFLDGRGDETSGGATARVFGFHRTDGHRARRGKEERPRPRETFCRARKLKDVRPTPTHKASTVHHHAIVHGVVRKPRYQGVRGHSLTRAASRGLCVHHQAIVRAPDGLSYQVWQRSTIRQPRASLNSARSCASDMRRGPGPEEPSCIPCARYSAVWLHDV